MLFMDYAEVDLWEDTVQAGNIWNYQWSSHTFEEILQEHADTVISPKQNYTSAIHWLTNLASLLQKTQTALYSTRRMIVKYANATLPPHGVSIRRACTRRKRSRSQTLFTAWNIRYTKRVNTPKRSPRYIYRSDLAPLLQAILPIQMPGSTSSRPTRALTLDISLGLKHPPTRFRRLNTKIPQREVH